MKDVTNCGLFNLLRAPHIQLVAQSPWLKNIGSKATETQGVNLRFSSRRGHIFVQTDQPIYNPGQRGEHPASGPLLCLSQAAQSMFGALYVRATLEACLAVQSPRSCPVSFAQHTHLSPTPYPLLSSLSGLCTGSKDAPIHGYPHGHSRGGCLTSDLPDPVH